MMRRPLVWLAISIFAVLVAGFFAGAKITSDFFANSMPSTRFQVADDRLYVRGEINALSLGQFNEVVSAFPWVKVLVLDGISGSSDDETNVKLGYRVRELGLATHVPAGAEVYSGGVDLFLAGVERTLAEGAVLGVHSWSDGIHDGAHYPKDSPEHEEARKYTEDMLGDDRFYWFTLSAAPADGIHVMTDKEIREYGLLTD